MGELNPQSCVHLFDLALQAGFTTMHSFLMFREDFHLLELSYRIMESSNKYSVKQLEFASTMLIAHPVHWGLVSKRGLVSEFDDNDKKRYTNVIIQSESDDPLFEFVCLNWSENGLKTGGPSMTDRLSLEHDEVMASLAVGDHMIRYVNEPYLNRYQEPTWIPVMMRDGDMFDPSPFT